MWSSKIKILLFIRNWLTNYQLPIFDTIKYYQSMDVLKNFQEISIETPVDKIIRQIRELITSGQLNPGDRLPPERKLAEKLGVGRTNVRDAIKKLEFYGILKTLPQSGTIVAGIGIAALEGLITDVLKMENSDFKALVETRIILEAESVKLAAERRTEEDIKNIKMALDAYEYQVEAGSQAIEEDLLFHLKIAEASKNSVLKSLMLIIIPDVIKEFKQLEICRDGRYYKALEEHKVIFHHIIKGEPEKAAAAMRIHLSGVLEYSKTL